MIRNICRLSYPLSEETFQFFIFRFRLYWILIVLQLEHKIIENKKITFIKN